MRDPTLKRYQRALSTNPESLQPTQEAVTWDGVPAVKWTFPESTFVVGFIGNPGFTVVNLRVPKKLQRKGIGSQVLRWLHGYYFGEVQVQEVQDSAIGFWNKALDCGLIARYTQDKYH